MDKTETFNTLAAKSAKYMETVEQMRRSGGIESHQLSYFLGLSIVALDDIEEESLHESCEKETFDGVPSFLAVAGCAMCGAAYIRGISPDELVAQMTETYRRKNADYGDSFERSLSRWGIIAALVRMYDKTNRLDALVNRGQESQVKDESVFDTFLDLASYAIMSAMWFKAKEERP